MPTPEFTAGSKVRRASDRLDGVILSLIKEFRCHLGYLTNEIWYDGDRNSREGQECHQINNKYRLKSAKIPLFKEIDHGIEQVGHDGSHSQRNQDC